MKLVVHYCVMMEGAEPVCQRIKCLVFRDVCVPGVFLHCYVYFLVFVSLCRCLKWGSVCLCVDVDECRGLCFVSEMVFFFSAESKVGVSLLVPVFIFRFLFPCWT